MINECVITQQEAVDAKDSGQFCLTQILIEKGFEYTDHPIQPSLAGSVGVTRDVETGDYLYKQKTGDDI